MKCWKEILFSLLLLFSGCTLIAGNYSGADSLKRILEHSHGAVRADILNRLAAHYYQEDPEESRRLSMEAFKVSEKLKYAKGCGESWYNLAKYYSLQKNNDSTLAAYKEAVQHFSTTDEKDLHSASYNAIGLMLMNNGEYSRALDHLVKALVLRQEMGDSVKIGGSYCNIGIVMEYLNEKEQALEYYHNALQFLKGGRNKHFLANTLMNIGVVNYSMKNYDEAHKYYSEALELQQLTSDEHGMANMYMNLGNLFNTEKKYDKAIAYHRLALEMGQRLQDLVIVSGTYINLGNIYSELSEYHKALDHLNRGLEIAKEINHREWIKNASQGLADCYASMGLNEQAFHIYKAFSDLKDSLLQEYSKNEIAKIKAVLEIERNKTARLTAELKEAKLHQDSIKRNMLVMGFLLVMILTVVFYYYVKSREEI